MTYFLNFENISAVEEFSLISCFHRVFEGSVPSIIINAFRAIAFFSYLILFINLFMIKEIRSKQMMCILNLNLISVVFFIYQFVLYYQANCMMLDDIQCIIQAFLNYYNSILSSYGLCALTIYRLLCYTVLNLKKKLTLKVVIYSMAAVWILPFIFTIIQMFAFETSFTMAQDFNTCFTNMSQTYSALIFYVFYSMILPNAIIVTTFIIVLKKQTALTHSLNSQLPNNSNRRLRQSKLFNTQLTIYILLFELSVVLHIVIYVHIGFKSFLSENMILISKFLLELRQFCPLALLISHKAVLQKM